MNSGLRFVNKVVIVTGGGQGIGGACCEIFAREGAKLVVADINEATGVAVAKRLVSEGGEAHFIHTDVTKENSIKNMIKDTVAKFGRIDCLVNNAGGGSNVFNGIEMALKDWNDIISLNLTSHWLTTVYAAREMKKTGGGAIVNVSSMGAFRNHAQANMAYLVAKLGVVRVTEVAAFRLGPDNIRVNCVAPGVTMTPLTLRGLSEEDRARGMRENTVLQRFAMPEDQAEAIAYLCSDVASYISGETIRVDGGWYTI